MCLASVWHLYGKRMAYVGSGKSIRDQPREIPPFVIRRNAARGPHTIPSPFGAYWGRCPLVADAPISPEYLDQNEGAAVPAHCRG